MAKLDRDPADDLPAMINVPDSLTQEFGDAIACPNTQEKNQLLSLFTWTPLNDMATMASSASVTGREPRLTYLLLRLFRSVKLHLGT